ncbi:amino acid transporter [Blastocystis sp. subtype 4]|uniref:amino acid transporter n=1 Tax=Blastocystis sp. subtype 4 TaxID=944170 RepID=UPI0007121158|nr:amino acid transporter [Blastocystis sp. subtype 4]KNB45005.1 amino acid transporter [Blastocystis sp. subtype 4]|eukprot:XP_014528448.1 amino acid transporter [Blastocystis sp. subtype 4]
MDVTEPVEQVNEPTLPLPQEVTAPLLPEKPQEDSDANASVGASIINMTNNVLGSGLVALAYSMKQCSLVPGIILLTLLAAIACFSQIIITRSCRITEKYTYKEMGNVFFVVDVHF